MIRREVTSYPVSIFMAGDIAAATDYVRCFCDDEGLCVTITPTAYIYTSGQEAGFIVGLINYPRFPAKPEDIWAVAEQVASYLRERLYQDSYTIQAPDKTVWFSHRREDATLAQKDTQGGAEG